MNKQGINNTNNNTNRQREIDSDQKGLNCNQKLNISPLICLKKIINWSQRCHDLWFQII